MVINNLILPRYAVITANGKIIPDTEGKEPVLLLLKNQQWYFGKFSKQHYLQNQFYLIIPANFQEIQTEIEDFVQQLNINNNCQQQYLHLICPRHLAHKLIW